MRELSKFQITTVIFLLMFVFVVGAIYSNTKEAADRKLNANNAMQQRVQENYNYEQSAINENNSQIQDLTNRIDELSQQIASLKNIRLQERSNIKCQVFGIATSGGFIRLTPQEAITEARNNGSDLVMTCNF